VRRMYRCVVVRSGERHVYRRDRRDEWPPPESRRG
jgi:hypothetical protein